MDDYIFLIIAIAISIIGAIRSGKKKQSKPQQEAVPDSRSDDFSFQEWLAGDFGEDEPVESEPPMPRHVVEYREPVVPKSTLSRPPEYKSRFISNLPERNLKTSVNPMKIQEESEPVEEWGAEIQEGYLEDFSARKAIIYSEILNPKYLS